MEAAGVSLVEIRFEDILLEVGGFSKFHFLLSTFPPVRHPSARRGRCGQHASILTPPPLSRASTDGCTPAHSSSSTTATQGYCSTFDTEVSCAVLTHYVTAEQVRMQLRKISARKAAGPDGISPRLLKDCAEQLCGVVSHMFNLSLSLERVPDLWKTSCVVPIPKTAYPREPNHFGPVALTSHLMKTMERIMLNHLRPLVSRKLDPLQFAYQPGIGVDDAVIYLQHRSLSHLESSGSYVRVMFFDFSSAFDTIQPSLLRGKLEGAGVDHHLTAWIINYLTSRPHARMKFEDVLAEVDDFGRYQILMITLLCIPRVILPCHFLLNNFMAAVPDHRCDIGGLDGGKYFANLTQAQRLTVSIPAEDDGSLSSCKMFTEPQFHLLYNSSNATEIPAVPCQYGWVYDTSTFSSTLATEWDLICDRKGMNEATATIFFIGVMFGAVVFGSLSDSWLNNPQSESIKTKGLSQDNHRRVDGIEWVGIENRALIGVLGSASWSVGNMLLGGFAYLVNDWRLLIITVTSPLGLAVITWWWLPESARWLIANGKMEKAHMYLMKCAAFNNKMESASKIKPQTLSNVVTVDKNKRYTYLDLVRTPNMRKRVVLTGILWYGVASTYYGISLDITNFGLNIYLTHFIYGAIEIPAKIIVYFSLSKIGRRTTQVGTLILSGVCIAINIVVPRDMWYFRTCVAVLGKGLSEASFTTVFLYTTELYPTVVRQNGLGYTSFVARLGVSITPLILLLDNVWKLLPQVIICTVAISTGLLASMLPETHNELLPETIEDVEQTRRRSTSPSAQEKSDTPLKPLTNDVIENGR
ncbi:hypothetical protein SKAU_G00181070 [Synaphobranchus kaupii]|uniref:Reverse transcriptase domain-containing protein n=1 Tax=Synaphobranchus kaupii TaxID=118154 RepID=A0A9Q1FM65_SYNKA|nr:hypothetical protein SKAU_G00181070 [Synaphobranchus kaupii]